MNKKIFTSISIGVVLVGSIGSGIFYNKEFNSIHNETLLNKNMTAPATIKNNELKDVIKPDTIIAENNATHSSKDLIGNTVEKWISTTQFKYINFNPKETELTASQLEKLKYNQTMLYYSFIYANGVYATHKNITAKELNKTAIAVKEQITGNWTPPTNGWNESK